jgi:predicted ATPase
LRTAANVELELDGLTVLIGPNAVGKSSIIEGLELLHRVIAGDDLVRTLHEDHGGPVALVTHGANALGLGLEGTTEGESFSYEITLGRGGGGFDIAQESLRAPAEVFVRSGDSVIMADRPGTLQAPRTQEPLLRYASLQGPAHRVSALLEGIEVHGPFATSAAWLRHGSPAERGARADNIVQATARVARGGTNLPNAFHALRNRVDWRDTLETIRLVVDEDIVDVMTPASASGGSIGLAVRYRTGAPVPAFALSDGTLALLALVAITALDAGPPPRSLLVLDEPDLHLHPAAIRYVVTLLERCAKRYPVVIATHSDQLLDCLSDPARSIVLCDLDDHRHLRLQRPDAKLLAQWLGEYRGVGHLRAEGYDGLLFPPPAQTTDRNP